MTSFLSFIGRYGHIGLQALGLAAQVYTAYAQGGKVSAINAAIGLAQVALADQAYQTPPKAK